MECPYQAECGGCPVRGENIENYRTLKEAKVRNILQTVLGESSYVWEKPIFLSDGTRRRAALVFRFHKGRITLGFNKPDSSDIVDCLSCPMLTLRLNKILPDLRLFLEKLCAICTTEKLKGGKRRTASLTKGDLLILEADNGIDIVLEADAPLSMEHRLEIFDYMNAHDNLIRFSHRRRSDTEAEPILEKAKPLIHIDGYESLLPPACSYKPPKKANRLLSARS